MVARGEGEGREEVRGNKEEVKLREPVKKCTACLPLWGRCHRRAMTEGVSSREVPSPCPLPLLQYAQEVGLSQREGDFYFQNNIKFFKGALPPCTPKGALNPGSPFYFVFLGSETCLPHWGRCHAGGVTEGVSSREVPTPVSPAGSVGSRQSATGARSPPSHARTLRKEEAALAREGETILYISFQRGAMVASGDRLSPTEAAAETKLPLWNPRWGSRGK